MMDIYYTLLILVTITHSESNFLFLPVWLVLLHFLLPTITIFCCSWLCCPHSSPSNFKGPVLTLDKQLHATITVKILVSVLTLQGSFFRVSGGHIQMQNGDSCEDSTTATGAGDLATAEVDLEKQGNTVAKVLPPEGSDTDKASCGSSTGEGNAALVAIVVDSSVNGVASTTEELSVVDSPKKDFLSRNNSSHEQCRVCQQEKEEVLIDLGCKCKGGLAKAHRSCIDAWFRTRGSNKCEICQEVAANVSPPESQPSTNYWVWRIDPNYRHHDRQRGCVSPLWVAFSILVGGLLLDVLISITLGVSALPVNIIIGVIVVLGLGTALRLALEFFDEWHFRRAAQGLDANMHLAYHPGL